MLSTHTYLKLGSFNRTSFVEIQGTERLRQQSLSSSRVVYQSLCAPALCEMLHQGKQSTGGSNHADRRRLTFFPVDQGLIEWPQIKEETAGGKP